MSHGFLLQGGYVFGNAYTSDALLAQGRGRKQSLQTGDPGSITHALKFNWVYELPFGSGRRFLGTASGWVDRLVGGWEFDGIARIQSGRMLDFGNVRLVGMSAKDLQKAIKIQEYAPTGINATAPVNIYMLPQDIIENTIRAFSAQRDVGERLRQPRRADRTLHRAGQRAGLHRDDRERLRRLRHPHARALTGPMYSRWDISAVKRTRHRRPDDVRVPRRPAQRVQPPELHAGVLDVDQRRQLPRDRRAGELEPGHPAGRHALAGRRDSRLRSPVGLRVRSLRSPSGRGKPTSLSGRVSARHRAAARDRSARQAAFSDRPLPDSEPKRVPRYSP